MKRLFLSAFILLSGFVPVVHADTTPDFLIWSKTGKGLSWNTTDANWTGTRTIGETKFQDGDFAAFDGRGAGMVNVDDAGVIASGLEVSTGTHIFKGGEIKALASGVTAEFDGGLYLLGGETTFQNKSLDFEGGVFISGEGTSVRMEGTPVKTQGDFFLAADSSLFFVADTNSIVADSVSLHGNVEYEFKVKPTDGTRIQNVIITHDVNDRERLDELFCWKTHGLIGQVAMFGTTGDGSLTMDLQFNKIGVADFAIWERLHGNIQDLAPVLDSAFSEVRMDKSFLALKTAFDRMDTRELSEALDRMRGSELAADGLTIAMWKPWRATFMRLNEDQLNAPHVAFVYEKAPVVSESPEPASKESAGKVRGQLGTRRCSTSNFWIEFMTQSADISADRFAHGYTTDRNGVIIGLDWKQHNTTTFGAVLHYTNPELRSKYGQIEADDWGMAFYFKQALRESLYLNAYFGFGHEVYRYSRNDIGGVAKGDYDGNALYMSSELVRPIVMTYGWTLLPLVGTDYQKTWVGAFNETGTLFAQRIDDGEMESLMVRLGLNSRWRLTQCFSVDTRLQYGHQFVGDTYGGVNSKFIGDVGGTTMRLRGVDVGRDWLNVGIGAQTYLTACQRFYIFASYDYDVNYKSNMHTGDFGFALQW